MKQLKLTEKDYERGRKGIMALKSLSALSDYVEILNEWNYSDEDRARLMELVNERREQLAPDSVKLVSQQNTYTNTHQNQIDNNTKIYSPTEKPPHCNVHDDINDNEYGKLINTISPKYIVLLVKAVALSALGYYIFTLMLSEKGDFSLDTSSPKGFLPLITIIIFLGCIIYHLWLMTRKIKLYEKGFVICGIGGKKSFYNDIKQMNESYELERRRVGHNMPFNVKMPVYLINFKNSKEIILKKRHYVYLISKLEDVKTNLELN